MATFPFKYFSCFSQFSLVCRTAVKAEPCLRPANPRGEWGRAASQSLTSLVALPRRQDFAFVQIIPPATRASICAKTKYIVECHLFTWFSESKVRRLSTLVYSWKKEKLSRSSFVLYKVEVPSPGSIESDLKALLLKLPLSGLDPCTIWFTRNAILTGKSASQHRRVIAVHKCCCIHVQLINFDINLLTLFRPGQDLLGSDVNNLLNIEADFKNSSLTSTIFKYLVPFYGVFIRFKVIPLFCIAHPYCARFFASSARACSAHTSRAQ